MMLSPCSPSTRRTVVHTSLAVLRNVKHLEGRHRHPVLTLSRKHQLGSRLLGRTPPE